jgi:hypothetical protein
VASDLIEYAGPAARHGVTWEELPGGVKIVVPHRFRHYLFSGGSALEFVARPIAWLFLRMTGMLKPRAIIELNATQLSLIESNGAESITTHFARAEIAELRPNRYGPGIYLRIPGKTNLDLLTNVDPPLVKWIGETLQTALAKPVEAQISAS